MPYKESQAECDWCGKWLSDDGDMACKKCYEQLEGDFAEAQKEIARMRQELEELIKEKQ